MSEEIRAVPTQTRLATVQPATFNRDARTVEVVWTTGAAVRRFSPWDDEHYDEVLDVSPDAADLSRLKNGAPVLDSHARRTLGNQIGVVEDAWIADGVGRARIRLSGRQEVAGIVQDIADGLIRNISVGYTVERYEVTRGAEVPVWRATRWQPQELSFVTVPADAGATVRSTDNAQGQPCVIHRADVAQPAEEATAMAEETEVTRAAAEQPPAVVPAEPEINHAERAAEIIELATRHNMHAQAAEWVRGSLTVDQVRAKILDKLVKDGDAGPKREPEVRAGKDESEKLRDAQVEVLMARAGVADVATRQIVRVQGGNPFRGATLYDLARSSLERAGQRTDGLSRMEIVGRAFTQTTGDFPVLLETAMHKALQSAYALTPDTWSRFCATGTVSDFRAHSRYQVSSIGNLDSLTEANEFRHKAINDGKKESITASTKGNIITLTRQAIINDDLGAFMGLASAFGRAARRTIEAGVYTYLASNPALNEDSTALFHADHGNLAGSGGAPTVDTIEAGRVAMAKQRDVGANDYLDIRPAIWVGPMATGGEARVINDAQYDPDTANKLQRPNKVRGLFRDVVDTPRITGTEWYLFADPSVAPVIEVAFLDDQREPYLEMEDGFTVDGTRWKARLDYGIAAVDFRGAYKNAGG